jgi:hypothetical protein
MTDQDESEKIMRTIRIIAFSVSFIAFTVFVVLKLMGE